MHQVNFVPSDLFVGHGFDLANMRLVQNDRIAALPPVWFMDFRLLMMWDAAIREEQLPGLRSPLIVHWVATSGSTANDPRRCPVSRDLRPDLCHISKAGTGSHRLWLAREHLGISIVQIVQQESLRWASCSATRILFVEVLAAAFQQDFHQSFLSTVGCKTCSRLALALDVSSI